MKQQLRFKESKVRAQERWFVGSFHTAENQTQNNPLDEVSGISIDVFITMSVATSLTIPTSVKVADIMERPGTHNSPPPIQKK